MTKTSQMMIRIDPDLKNDAEGVLAQIGLSPTEFVRMSLRQLVMRQGLPFDARIPNTKTIDALAEPADRLQLFSTTREMFDALDAQINDD